MGTENGVIDVADALNLLSPFRSVMLWMVVARRAFRYARNSITSNRHVVPTKQAKLMLRRTLRHVFIAGMQLTPVTITTRRNGLNISLGSNMRRNLMSEISVTVTFPTRDHIDLTSTLSEAILDASYLCRLISGAIQNWPSAYQGISSSAFWAF